MKIDYIIKFHSPWHCGSGLAAGADSDLLVIKDKNGLPFVPGKTIKGLVREAATDILCFDKENVIDMQMLFGEESNYEKGDTQQGCLFFTNAGFPQEIAESIIAFKDDEFLYSSTSSTAIDEDGVAKKHSLRKMEVTIPCELEGSIWFVPDSLCAEFLVKALKYIKRIGQNRNRGLGRCSITIKKEGGEE